ncbi:aminopeptidase P family protein [Sporosarcina sp. E16_3]|uniref:M24 family metallopeptidase n=1 Tax=Sporosarcina sp. E16_3 TaxID=2789293 RepID=UPI001A92015D|nr:Xaa-Pro peptidase family protein [Sporosarcina sp. E16_3]MBO0603149.1 aminopeptidase P family protein [Sporosarcina sp. E16_3]
MEKLVKLRGMFDELGIDGILITDAMNRRYLTDFTGSAGTVVVTKADAYLLVDFRYVSQANAQVTNFTVKEIDRAIIYEEISTLAESFGIKKLGFEQQHQSYFYYSQLLKSIKADLVPVSNVVEELRMIKNESEIAILKKAAEISDAAFAHIVTFIRPGRTEIEIANELEFHMRKLGATSSSFDIIVASGIRSALPHGVASDKVVEKGDMITLDFGAYYLGYCSDMTRTIAVGEPNPKLKEIHAIVHDALENALSGIKAGMTGKEADALTRNLISDKGYGDYYGHGMGHGIGLYIHEDIFMNPTCEQHIVEGMVLTVEPGIYIPGLGGVRIEDDIIVKKNGIEIITKSQKELIIL